MIYPHIYSTYEHIYIYIIIEMGIPYGYPKWFVKPWQCIYRMCIPKMMMHLHHVGFIMIYLI